MRILRPELPLAAGMCVALGELLALGGFPRPGELGLGFLCGFFLSGAALVFNDYFDLEVDRLNAPQRPLPAGLLTPAEVLVFGGVVSLAGLAAAWAFGALALVFGLVVWALGFLYNWKLKAAGIWGNLIVSASVASTFVLGGMIAGNPWNRMVWVFALLVGVFDLAEEIAGDALDMEGDRLRGSRSLAILWGKRAALNLTGVLFGVVIALTLWPVWWGDLGLRYLIPIAITDLLILYYTVRLVQNRSEGESRAAMRKLYLGASLGFLAFLVGSLF